MSRPLRAGRWPGGRRLVAGLLGVCLILAGVVLVVGWALRPGFTPAGALPASSTAPARSAASPAPTAAGSSPAATPSHRIAAGSGALVDASFSPGRLVLQALGVDAAVVPVGVGPGGALTIPDNARVIGWWSGGAAPGSPVGTVLMAGHVDSAQTGPGALARLSQAPVGARLTVRGPGSEMTYVVCARRRYLKADLPWRTLFAQGELPRLVLVTCGGDFDSRTKHYTDNVVVIATPS
ncbi:MAG TPA: class F sortase [Dermatophilaceae bacterium]